jgi:hypothetical protein
MDPATAEAALKTGAALITVINALGPWGLLALVLGTNLAVPLVVLVFWFVNAKRQDKLVEGYRADMNHALKEYGAALGTVSKYYEDNVELVRDFQKIADGFQSVVVLNTQAMQRLVDRVDNNLWCPVLREQIKGQK